MIPWLKRLLCFLIGHRFVEYKKERKHAYLPTGFILGELSTSKCSRCELQLCVFYTDATDYKIVNK